MNTSTFSRRNGVWRSIRICFSLRTVWHSSRTGSRTPSSLHVWYKAISTAFVLMVAYATSCMRFPARKPLMNAAVIVNLFPGVLSMIAVYFILKTLNLTNTHLGLILVYSAGAGLGYLTQRASSIRFRIPCARLLIWMEPVRLRSSGRLLSP